jgi:hypothetical protein
LYVIQKGGANLMVLASAIALPLSQLTFAIRPIMMGRTEQFHATDAIALVCALVGFYIYEKYGKPPVESIDSDSDDEAQINESPYAAGQRNKAGGVTRVRASE